MSDSTEAPRQLEALPTPELIAKKEGRIEYGGQGRMETASARVVINYPFDLLDRRGAFEHDYRALIDRFKLAYDSHCISLGAWSGKLGEGSFDAEARVPCEALYRAIMRRMPKPKLDTLLMLIAPIPDGADLEKLANHLIPRKRYFTELLELLSDEMQEASKLAMEGVCENGGGI